MLGVILSTTALPAMADVVSPSTTFGVGTTTTTDATTTTVAPTTTTTLKKVRHVVHVRATIARHSHVVASSTTNHARSNQSGSTSPTTTTPTPTTVVTPTTVAPTPTTTIKPVTKAPAHSVSNPSANIAPSPNFLAPGACSFASGVWSCANPCVAGTASALSWPGYTNGVACTNYILSAINNARAVEGVRPMVLPTNWFSLSVPQQLFVLVDLERTARGLPAYLGINAALTADAQHAAATNSDPSIAAGFAMANDAQGSAGFGGAWSGGFNPLAADYIWMYDDTWGGSAAKTSNIACTSAGAAGCWAHRDELLGSDPGYNQGVGLGCTNCEVGTGFAMVNGNASYADLIEIPKGTPPPMSFTWANNVLPNLP
ncbi:MAG TPA: hypothetical protein VIH73_05605 [Acidimicrobiales bacterium]